MNMDDFAELSAAAALGALGPDDQRAFDAALAEHPEWADIVAADAATAAQLAEAAPEVAPPPAIRDALLARIAAPAPHPDDAEDSAAAGPAPVMPDAPTAGSSGWGARRWFALAASVVLLVALGFGAVTVSQFLNRPAAVVAMEEIRSAPDAQSAQVELAEGGEATAYWSAERGQAVLVADGLPRIEDDRTFEMWLINEDAGAVSAGLFSTDDGDATAVLAGEYQPGDVIAVTVEPAGGAPGGVATGEPIVVIPTA
ncbi:anti-sigma factor domain-containing protein [Microbacterium sp. RD1]|uniref:anti-sigma factor n=1 Tax=Microbacterium sp. RD1 TaxID=3457313 RepID=UPI003FA553E4